MRAALRENELALRVKRNRRGAIGVRRSTSQRREKGHDRPKSGLRCPRPRAWKGRRGPGAGPSRPDPAVAIIYISATDALPDVAIVNIIATTEFEGRGGPSQAA